MRLSKNDNVSLEERLYIQRCADKDPSINNWLNKAKRIQRNKVSSDSIEMLLDDLDIGSTDPDNSFKVGEDDLGEWFSGAPSWLARS